MPSSSSGSLILGGLIVRVVISVCLVAGGLSSKVFDSGEVQVLSCPLSPRKHVPLEKPGRRADYSYGLEVMGECMVGAGRGVLLVPWTFLSGVWEPSSWSRRSEIREVVVLMMLRESSTSRVWFLKVSTNSSKDITCSCIAWRSRHIWVSSMLPVGVSIQGILVGCVNGPETGAGSPALEDVISFCLDMSYG